MNTCSLIKITSLFRTLIGLPRFGNEGPGNASIFTRRPLIPRELVGRLGTRLHSPRARAHCTTTARKGLNGYANFLSLTSLAVRVYGEGVSRGGPDNITCVQYLLIQQFSAIHFASHFNSFACGLRQRKFFGSL